MFNVDYGITVGCPPGSNGVYGIYNSAQKQTPTNPKRTQNEPETEKNIKSEIRPKKKTLWPGGETEVPKLVRAEPRGGERFVFGRAGLRSRAAAHGSVGIQK